MPIIPAQREATAVIAALRMYDEGDVLPVSTSHLYSVDERAFRTAAGITTPRSLPVLHDIPGGKLPAVERVLDFPLMRGMRYEVWAPWFDEQRNIWDTPSGQLSVYHRADAIRPDLHPADGPPWHMLFFPWMSDTPMSRGFETLEAAIIRAREIEEAYLFYRHETLDAEIRRDLIMSPVGTDLWIPDLRDAEPDEPWRHYFKPRRRREPRVITSCDEHGAILNQHGWLAGRSLFGHGTQVAEFCAFCECVTTTDPAHY